MSYKLAINSLLASYAGLTFVTLEPDLMAWTMEGRAFLLAFAFFIFTITHVAKGY